MHDPTFADPALGRPIRSAVAALSVLLLLGFLALVLDLERFPLIHGRTPSGPTRLAVGIGQSGSFEVPASLLGTPGGQAFERYRRSPGSAVVITVDDGYLFGFDGGEFEGSMAWLDRSGRAHDELERTDDHRQRNVVAIATDGRNALFICGLAHLGIDTGAIHRFVLDGTWKRLDTLPLPGCPTSVVLEWNGTLRIGTRSKDELLYRGDAVLLRH